MKQPEQAEQERNRLRAEFEQAGSPGGDFYLWLCNRLDASILKAKAAQQKWKQRKFRRTKH